MDNAHGDFENLGSTGSFDTSGKPEVQPEAQEAPASESVEEIVPPKETLISMTPSQLEELKRQIVEETTKKMEEGDYIERMRATLERDSAMKKVNAKGQFADPALKVIRSGSLGPIDHQEAVVAPFKTDPSMKYRVINKANDELYQLRRYQGYEPVRDDDGSEVRYMDGVLAAMPKRHYDETVGAQTQARKMLRRQSAKDRAKEFIEMGEREGLKMTGDGVKIDVTTKEE